MACGFGPQIFELVAKLQEENNEKIADSSKEIENKIEFQKTFASTAQEDLGNPADWTENYRKWDKWEDLEELEQKAEAERKKMENMARNKTMCSHDHSAERKIAELPLAEQLAAMARFRSIGNMFHEEGQYTRAAINYKKTLIYYDYCFPETDEDQATADELRLTTLLNSAACFLRTSHTHEALNSCNQALSIDSNNIKALYRKAQAFRMQDKFSEAKECLKIALVLQPHDIQLRRELNRLKGKIAGYKRRSAALGKRLFSCDGPPPKHQITPQLKGDSLLFPLKEIHISDDDQMDTFGNLYIPLQYDGWKRLFEVSALVFEKK